MASGTCTNCDRPLRGKVTTTVTGRKLCEDCSETLTSLTLGVMAGTGTAETFSIAGWAKELLGRRRKGHDATDECVRSPDRSADL